jgi:hypothetical protein
MPAANQDPLANENAKDTFTLPGHGKLVLVNRKARIGRNRLLARRSRSRPSAW